MAATEDLVFGEATKYLSIFGVTVASWWTLKFLCSLWTGLKSFFLGLGADVKKFGQWAVVTGATDGIGKAYAQELARKGMDIVLVSRNPEKLSDVAKEIESQYKVKTKCIAVDFTGGPEIYAKIKKELAGLEVGVLVNNVGMSYACPDYYESLDAETVRNMINMNCNSVAEMTSLVLPGMSERRKGAIINVSSASGALPTPFLSLYSATKSFVDFFSEAVKVEYAKKGIIVQSVMPYFVTTKLSKIRRASFLVPKPDTYVRQALSTLGVQSRTFGCVSHSLQGFLALSIPKWLYQTVSSNVMLFLQKKNLELEARRREKMAKNA